MLGLKMLHNINFYSFIFPHFAFLSCRGKIAYHVHPLFQITLCPHHMRGDVQHLNQTFLNHCSLLYITDVAGVEKNFE